ncbi:hypothetical protein RHMOL_Rhmol01G0017900 [Rhododendron molle]|uniref:Uncharacterized protein n=1 Tax=Rhododendron molle TaxID=49168 RepID=A0ACC0PYG8_RHOML|nr:hypothetical protein RHMOL_Rhmol01G0017900 [Rhododendron molle]
MVCAAVVPPHAAASSSSQHVGAYQERVRTDFLEPLRGFGSWKKTPFSKSENICFSSYVPLSCVTKECNSGGCGGDGGGVILAGRLNLILLSQKNLIIVAHGIVSFSLLILKCR